MTPEEILRESRQRAQRAAEEVGVARVRKILLRAKQDLDRRVAEAEGLRGPGADSFTAVQARAVLRQVEDVLRTLKPELRDTILEGARERAEPSAKDVIAYLKAADARYRGTARPLALDEALMFEQAKRGAESTVLRRILSDPKDRARPGVLDRYGAATIGHFEEALAQRTLAAKPWAEVREDLVKASPFLQAAPAHWAERIVRTESMAASNAASQASIEEANTQLDGEMLKILSATFDARTAADSYAVHGQIRRPSEAFQDWTHSYMHPPNRPNDREVVVPHRASWPLPKSILPRSDGEVAAAWAREGRKGSPPARPIMSTVDLKAMRAESEERSTRRPVIVSVPDVVEVPVEEEQKPRVKAPPAPAAAIRVPRFRNEEQRAAHAARRLSDIPRDEALSEGMGREDVIRHPLQLHSEELDSDRPWAAGGNEQRVLDLARELRNLERSNNAPTLRQIRIDQIVALDPDVFRSRVLEEIRRAQAGDADTPILVRHGGKLYALENLEGIIAAKLGERRTVQAHVIDLGAKNPWPKPAPKPAVVEEVKSTAPRVPVEVIRDGHLDHVKKAGLRIYSDEVSFDYNAKKVFTEGMPKIDTLQKTWGSNEAGHTIVLTSATARPDRVNFEGDIMAGSKRIGSITRTFIRHLDGALEVHHDFFKIDDVTEQGKKGGSTMLRQAIQTYEKIGVKEVTVDAAWVGRYAWATFGYNWDSATAADTARRLTRFMIDKGVDQKRAEVIAKGASVRAWDVAALDVDGITVTVNSEGKKVDCKIGKAFLLSGGMWSGKIVLDPKHETYQRAKERIGL